jgi:hypothetical protein
MPARSRCGPDRIRGGLKFAGHRGTGTALDGRRREWEILGDWSSPGRAVAVHVFHRDQQRAGALSCGQHRALQWREPLWPLRVGRVEALVDHGRAPGRVSRGLRVGRIHRAPFDPIDEQTRPVPRHHADVEVESDKMVRERATDVSRAEHQMPSRFGHSRAAPQAEEASSPYGATTVCGRPARTRRLSDHFTNALPGSGATLPEAAKSRSRIQHDHGDTSTCYPEPYTWSETHPL